MPTKCKRTGEDRRTWRESENHIIDKLDNERGLKFDTQVSYKNRKPGGGSGSTRPDGFHKGPPPTSIEIKNYNKENYSNMKTNLKKQRDDREVHLPEGTIQEAHIDIAGQNLTKTEQKALIEDIKSLGYDKVRLHSDAI